MFHMVFIGHKVSCRKDRHMFGVTHDLARQGIDFTNPIDFIAKNSMRNARSSREAGKISTTSPRTRKRPR